MPFKRTLPLLIAIAVVALGILPASALKLGAARKRVPAAKSSARAQAVKPAASSPAPTVHERFATFLASEGFKSVLLLENFRPDVPVTVSPTLILSEGEVPLDPVTLPAHTTATVDIDAFLLAHGYPDKRGTVSLRYTFSSYGPVTAVVQSVDEAHHLYLNSFAQTQEEYWAGTAFDAVIWAPEEDTQGFISITNTSSERRVVHATLLVKEHSEELPAIEIAPRRTRVLPIEHLVARSRENGAGIHVEFDEYPGDILVEGQLFNKRTGFAKNIHFADKALQYPTATLRTHFMLLGHQPAEDGFPAAISFRSVAAVRNIDAIPLRVTPTVKFLRNGSVHTVSLKQLVLTPGESRIIDFTEEQESRNLPRDLHQASLQLVPDNDHGRIVGELFNFSEQDGGYVVGPTFTSYPNRGTASIWRIDGTFQTTIMVENTADQEDKVSLKLFSESGTYEKAYTLPVGGLLKINVKDLQLNAVPDKDGHLLLGTSGIMSIAGSHNARSKLTFDKIIHSTDEADYVGLPPSPCDYVGSIFLSIDTSGGQNPFPVMAEYDWSLSGAEYESASGTSSGNSTLVHITNPGSGDVATINPDGQSHLVGLSGPPTNAPGCAACSSSTFYPQGSVTVPPVTVTFSGTPVVPLGGTATILATVNPPNYTSTILLTLSTTSGTGSAVFVDNGGLSTMNITGTTTLSLTGVQASSTSNNISLTATTRLESSNPPVGSTSFTVAATNGAIPVNFRQDSVSQLSNGVLRFHYSWESSSGPLSNLAQCQVREFVTYRGYVLGQQGQYFWTSPPYAAGSFSLNPDTGATPGPATGGGLTDAHGHVGFLSPYTADDATSNQVYQFQCPYYQNNQWITLSPQIGTIAIRRVVAQSGSSWRYTITKSGASNSINPLP